MVADRREYRGESATERSIALAKTLEDLGQRAVAKFGGCYANGRRGPYFSSSTDNSLSQRRWVLADKIADPTCSISRYPSTADRKKGIYNVTLSGDPIRGSVFGRWTFNDNGGRFKAMDIPVADKRDTDVVVLSYGRRNGMIRIIDQDSTLPGNFSANMILLEGCARVMSDRVNAVRIPGKKRRTQIQS